LHHLANSYSQKLIFQDSLIVSDIFLKIGKNFSKGKKIHSFNLKIYNL
jgi:hypothetical protein